LMLEAVLRVVVEADDEPRKHLDAVGINTPDRGQDVLVQVLGLFRLFEAFGIRRLDADEDPAEIRVAKELEEIGMLREIERSLGAERQTPAVGPLIFAEKAQKLARLGQVADEIVVDEERAARAVSADGIQLAPDLLQALDPWLAPEHDDDVAELAAERTAA